MTKKALVLGGGGFIGGHLAKRLKDEGFWVRVVDIKEKLDTADKFINGGFFVINKMALQYVNNLSEQWEMEPLSKIASDGQLMAFKHRGFWKAMDHLRDKIQLDGLANQKNPPWKTWK